VYEAEENELHEEAADQFEPLGDAPTEIVDENDE
jgi:hypothetical protein